MADIGTRLDSDSLVLWRGRDFKWTFENLDASGEPVNFPAGTLYFELQTSPKTEWEFDIVGAVATIKVESTDADAIPDRTKWQLVFLPDGEASGGDPLAWGTVSKVG
ncbi:hypothetical protein SEA_SOYO_3 [Mycobacterium phage SoYo]|uniref:LtfC/p132/Gp6 beta-sandwich domain-containing protein n=43 Tax=Microwolfvirus TaxID=2942894 RepID=A0A0A7RW22_9CAUD|nr:hypothetical protein PBI_BXZ2_3 [Mycobacterium phage Bxz2]YP_009198431.1 hypothetical protein AVV34_gp03 [Mycobacterium phage MarQuardt]YP_009219067.1 hypothetical protein AVV42_gp03 [Mycobacterium phage Anubis]YP_009635596.1 tail protein [Mycobacterium phage JHC117]YP_009635681.1 hypothetical protein FGG61_gp03 [Mycobacterium phage Microwolf]AEK07668.1 hypothetical protein VIX_3 [Mycobacterium phage Vix]AGK87207.1 hypothetical protein PBI_METHUSELAH_3 [Mycobacterium phage Methuselah]AIM5